jgi:MFS family permease
VSAPSRSLLLGISVLWIPLAFLTDGVTVLLLPVRLGADATAIGLVSFAGLGVGALLQPLVGWLGDRLRHRRDRRALIALATLPALGGLWLLAGATGVVMVVVGYVVIQAAAAAIQANQQALMPELVADEARGRASGLKAAFDVGGSFLAFGLLGALLVSGDLWPAVAATSAALILTTAVMLGTVPRPDAEPTVAPPTNRRAAPDVGQPGALAIPGPLWPLIISRLLFLLGVYVVGRFLVLLVAERTGIQAERAADEAGGLLALFTLATAVSALGAGRLADRVSRRDLAVAGALFAAFGIVVLVPAAGVPGLVVGGLLMSGGTAAFVTANWAETASIVPAGSAGRLMGIANLGTALGAAGAGLLGPLIDVTGFGPALSLAAVATAGAALPVLRPFSGTRSVRSAT